MADQPRGETVSIWGLFIPDVVRHDTGRHDTGHITGRDRPEDPPDHKGVSVWPV